VNWEAIGAVGEVLGSLAVLLTLIYLASQIRQSNHLARFNATKEIVNQFNQLNQLVATDGNLRNLLAKTGELSSDEREQIYNFAIMWCNVWLSSQIAMDNHQVEEETYAACARDVHVELARWPNFRAGVQQWLQNYPENAHHRIFRPARAEATEA
jgi:hypothetical protein